MSPEKRQKLGLRGWRRFQSGPVLNYAWIVTKANEREGLTETKELACKSTEIGKYRGYSGLIRNSILLLFIVTEKAKV